MEMMDHEEGTRQETQLETLPIPKTMEPDMRLIHQMIRPRIPTRTRKAAGMTVMKGITDAFAFMYMLRRRVQSLALR